MLLWGDVRRLAFSIGVSGRSGILCFSQTGSPARWGEKDAGLSVKKTLTLTCESRGIRGVRPPAVFPPPLKAPMAHRTAWKRRNVRTIEPIIPPNPLRFINSGEIINWGNHSEVTVYAKFGSHRPLGGALPMHNCPWRFGKVWTRCIQ